MGAGKMPTVDASMVSSESMSDASSHGATGTSLLGRHPKESRNRSLSLSLSWRRPKPSLLAPQAEFPQIPHQASDLAVDDDSSDAPLQQSHRFRRSSHGHSPSHSGSIKGIFRRASMSLKGMVNRRPSIATDDAIYEEMVEPQRPTTGYPSSWNRPQTEHTVRQSRSFYGLEFTHEPLAIRTRERPTHTSYHAKPGMAGEPPVIPYNTGASAKAAAAMQNELFGRQPMQSRWLHAGAFDEHNDGESGIGITVTAPDQEEEDSISKVDFIRVLPAELAINILARLDAAALSHASLVSRTWRNVVSNRHVWRESCLRETSATYATSGPIQPNTGLGLPKVTPANDWKKIYKVKKELDERWKMGQACPVYLNGHTDSIYCLQFDEHKIITGSRDKTIRIWDMHTFECRLIIGPPEVVHAADMMTDENGEPVHHATVEPSNGKLAASYPKPLSFAEHHKASILCLQYDDEILATGSSDGSAIIYDIRNGYKPIRRLRRHSAAVLDLAFDDKYIVTCSKDITICVWDRATGDLIRQLRGHTGPVNAVQMRGNTIVSCSGDFRVKLWNIDTGKCIREFIGHTKGLACSQFSEDGRYVASAGNDKAIFIWDANTGECIREMEAHDNLVRSLYIDSVSGRLVSGSYDTDIKVWDMETGQQLLDFPHWHSSWVLSAKCDYRRIVSTGQDPKILIMDFGAEVEGIEMLESEASGTDFSEGSE